MKPIDAKNVSRLKLKPKETAGTECNVVAPRVPAIVNYARKAALTEENIIGLGHLMFLCVDSAGRGTIPQPPSSLRKTCMNRATATAGLIALFDESNEAILLIDAGSPLAIKRVLSEFCAAEEGADAASSAAPKLVDFLRERGFRVVVPEQFFVGDFATNEENFGTDSGFGTSSTGRRPSACLDEGSNTCGVGS